MIQLADADSRLRALTDLDATLMVEAAAGTGKTALMAGRVTISRGRPPALPKDDASMPWPPDEGPTPMVGWRNYRGGNELGERIKLTASDGFVLNAYKAPPEGNPKAAVVLIQEVWGLNRWIRSEVDRYAAAGYLTVAPAMMDRVELGYESEDYGQSGFAKIGELMKTFNQETAILDVEAAITEVAGANKVGITGYCFGGAISWRAAHLGLGLSAASGYYGGGLLSYIDAVPKIPIEMHYGDSDKGIPVEQVEQLRKRYPQVPVYLYPAGHGFCNADRPGNYDAESCKKANARTLAFFAKHLG